MDVQLRPMDLDNVRLRSDKTKIVVIRVYLLLNLNSMPMLVFVPVFALHFPKIVSSIVSLRDL